jgi:hypothetical protein
MIQNPTAQDGALATALVSAPAWAPWLNDLNQLLTTASLGVGLALGAGRLWMFLRDRRKP